MGTILDNGAGFGGAGISASYVDLVLRGGTNIEDNIVTPGAGQGGGVYLTNGGSVIYDGVTIGDNYADSGDGVYREAAVQRYYLPGGVTFYGGNSEYTP